MVNEKQQCIEFSHCFAEDCFISSPAKEEYAIVCLSEENRDVECCINYSWSNANKQNAFTISRGQLADRRDFMQEVEKDKTL